MVIGGTFRDVVVRAASTRDLDSVLIGQPELPAALMREAGFRRVPGPRHAWRYRVGDRAVDLEVAAVASSAEAAGPFSVAFRHARTAVIEGTEVPVPRIEDYVILKLLAAAADRRRRARDLADVQYVFEAFRAEAANVLSIPRLRARLRDLYGVSGARLKELVALLRQVPRPE